MKVLVAPDSFKGSLDPTAVARALSDGWRRARGTDEIRLIPLADGGEGTLAAIKAADDGWVELLAHATDPLGRSIAASFLRRGDAAVIELAAASGLARVPPDERDPLAASTFGTGQVLAAAIGLGARDLVLGVGGSATTDGGSGLLEALGARFLDAGGRDVPRGGGALAQLARIDLDGLAPVLGEVSLTVASDVTNVLLGGEGAAAVYAPQKGAIAAQVAELDAALGNYADLLEKASGRHVRDVAGAGAAGGTTFGLLAIADRFESFAVRPGVELVMDLTGFEAALVAADLVLTGEGQVDAQTGYGKTARGVAERARAAGVGCICFGGGVTTDGIAALSPLGVVVVPVVERPQSLEEAMAGGAAPIVRAAERVARLASLFSIRGRKT